MVGCNSEVDELDITGYNDKKTHLLVNIFLRTRGYQNIFGPEDQDISDTGHNKISRPDNQDLAISLLGGKI
jgi:hypothetical protein